MAKIYQKVVSQIDKSRRMAIMERDADCEYFCKDCTQLRLSFIKDTSKCGNCGSLNIIKGKPGELDKETLLKEVKDYA